MTPPDQHDDRPVAFVLSGGGSIGAVQVGMLCALYERGIAPDLIVAASAGAFNGAFIASRPATADTAEALAAVWSGLHRGALFPLNPLTGPLGALGVRDHLIGSRGLELLLRGGLEFDHLQDAAIPLHLIATDLLSGQERRLSTGDTISAVLASAALPGVLPPVRRDGRVLVDGGVTNNTPLSHAIELGARTVYVLSTGYACALKKAPRGAIGIATQALSLLIQQRIVLDIQRVPEAVRLIVLQPLCPLDVAPTDFSHATELITRSRARTHDYLDHLDGAPHAVPDIMRTAGHVHARQDQAAEIPTA